MTDATKPSGAVPLRSGFLLAPLAMVLVLLLAACGGGDDGVEGASPEEPAGGDGAATDDGVDAATDEGGDGAAADGELSGELRWGIRDYFEAEAQQMIEAFEAENPGVSIQLELLPTDEAYVQRLLTARLGEALPDLIAAGDVYTELFADAEISADLTPYLEQSDELSRDYFSEAFLDAYIVKTGQYAGEIHALPQGADAIVIFYNKDHFDEAGLDYPDETWTYDDLVETAEQLTTGDRWGFTEVVDWHARYNPIIQAYGGQVVSEDGTQANLATEEALQAWRTMLEPMVAGTFVPREVQDTSTATALFAEGRTSMYPGVRAQVPQIRSEAAFEWDAVPTPLVNGERLSGAGSVAVAMTKAATDPDLAWAFLEWYFSEDGGMPLLTQSYGVVPPVPSLYKSDIWRELEPPPANDEAFVVAIETGVPAPLVPFDALTVWDQNIQEAVDAVTLGDAGIEEAFMQADERAQAILDESAQ